MYLFFAYLILLRLIITTAATKSKQGLYSKSDAVNILNSDNFDKNVLGKPNAWIIEFYNSWCGHCIHFAPEWKVFAKEQAAWSPVIKIGAVDCSAEENIGLCRKYDISMFPSFLLFPPNATPEDKGEKTHNRERERLLTKMIDFVSANPNFTTPNTWPKLKPLQQIEDIWEEKEEEGLLHILVFEEEDSYIGRQVILDLCQEKRLLVRRILKESVIKYVPSQRFPALYLLDQDGTYHRLAEGLIGRSVFVQAIKKLLPYGPKPKEKAGSEGDNEAGAGGGIGPDEDEKDRNVGDKKEDKNVETQHGPVLRPGVYMSDLESALHYSLRQEVAIKLQIEPDALEALKQFLHVLAKYFPGRDVVNSFLQKVYNWIKSWTGEMTGQVWSEKIDSLQTENAYLPDRIEWMACLGSEPKYRGYPCGMWTLFHTLTVSAYRSAGKNPRDLQLDVLSAIQGYMRHFFGCKTCVSHFLKMSSTVMSSDRIGSGPVIWLWRAHNSANARLQGDASEDPKHPKIQFPSNDLCPHCFEASKSNILEFLLNFYGSEKIIQMRSDEDEESFEKIDDFPSKNKDSQFDWWELQQRKKDLEKIHTLRKQKRGKLEQKRKDRKNALALRADDKLVFEQDFEEKNSMETGKMAVLGWGFSRLDMGMCVFFYVMCTVFILFLYYHFIVRRKHKIKCRLLSF